MKNIQLPYKKNYFEKVFFNKARDNIFLVNSTSVKICSTQERKTWDGKTYIRKIPCTVHNGELNSINYQPILFLVPLGLLIIFVFIKVMKNNKNLKTSRKNSQKIQPLTYKKFDESQMIIFLEKLKEGKFPDASIAKSLVNGNNLIVKDLKGSIITEIKIDEINKY